MHINRDPLGHVVTTQKMQGLHWSLWTIMFAVIALGAALCCILFPFAAVRGPWGTAYLPRVLLMLVTTIATIFALMSAILQSES